VVVVKAGKRNDVYKRKSWRFLTSSEKNLQSTDGLTPVPNFKNFII
jgi:hypothetical protein